MMIFPIFPKKDPKGFTLIELLVVIAILGILSGIIMLNVTSTTTRAKDSRIINETSQIRSAAGLYYSNNNYSFDNFDCTVVGLQLDMPALCNDINDMGGKNLIIVAANQEYCAEVQLNSNAWWCVDSWGRSARYYVGTTPTEPACAAGPPPVYTCE